MPHIPSGGTAELEVLRFEDAVKSGGSGDYDRSKWIYVPDFYSEYRYILGTRGEKPLIAVGINPSTAEPDNLDNTLKSVERIAHSNGYDSFVMFNVYAQRATDPDMMENRLNPTLHRENMKAFGYVLALSPSPSVWAAWGTVILKRPYLKDCVRDMISLGEKYGARWFSCGKRSKNGGHPHHPLYLKKDSPLDPFNAAEYIAGLK